MAHLKLVAVKLYIENPAKSLGKVNFLIYSTDFAFLVLLLFLQKL